MSPLPAARGEGSALSSPSGYGYTPTVQGFSTFSIFRMYSDNTVYTLDYCLLFYGDSVKSKLISEVEVLSEELCIFASWFLSPMSKNSVL